MDLKRIFRHLAYPDWMIRRAFPARVQRRIEEEVRGSERRHRGELKFALESGLDLIPLLRGVTARQRAIELFSMLRVWDTEENSGVLIYLQLADRDIEIVSDRGISGKVEPAQWEAVCRRMEDAFRAGRFEQGVFDGIREITALLVRHFPAGEVNPNELPDQPKVL